MFEDWQKKIPLSLSGHLLWEVNPKDIDYQGMKRLVVQRVIELGNENDFYFIFQQYGYENVVDTIKDLPQLSPKNESFVLSVFNLKKEDLLCYKRKQLREAYLNS